MSQRMVKCRKLGKELPGLKKPPFKNDLGRRIYEEVSEEAWKAWLMESVRIINTYLHNRGLDSPEAQELMMKQTALYFGFEEGDVVETAWTPPTQSEE